MNFFPGWVEGYSAPMPEPPRPGIPIEWDWAIELINSDIGLLEKKLRICTEERIFFDGNLVWVAKENSIFTMHSLDFPIEPVNLAKASRPVLFDNDCIFFQYQGFNYIIYYVASDDES